MVTLSIAEKLYHQLHFCINLLQRVPHSANRISKGKEIHRGQGRTLCLLNKNNGISQHALAELLHIRPPSMGELLNKLEANHLVERRSHETDQRVSNVFITDEGRQVVMEVEAVRTEHANTLFAGLSEEEQTTLSELLNKLIQTLKSKTDENSDAEAAHHGKHSYEHERHCDKGQKLEKRHGHQRMAGCLKHGHNQHED